MINNYIIEFILVCNVVYDDGKLVAHGELLDETVSYCTVHRDWRSDSQFSLVVVH